MMNSLRSEIHEIARGGRTPRLIVLTHDQLNAFFADTMSIATVLMQKPTKPLKFMNLPIVIVCWWDRNANVLDKAEAATFFDQRGKYDRPNPKSLT